MSRLFTFGCSFTKYGWPTWADLLGLEFDYSENWGVAGIGNVAIAQRIIECNSKHRFTQDDTIVVQWSSHLRNDFHRFSKNPADDTSYPGWNTNGSIFNYMNANRYDNKWIDRFFDEKSYVMYSLNAMLATKQILQNSKCNWAMTSIGDFAFLGNDFFNVDGYNEQTFKVNNIWKDYPEFQHYQHSIWNEDDQWCTPIGSFAWKDPSKLRTWLTQDREKYWTDPHPSLVQHAEWLTTVLKPKLNLQTDITSKQADWITRVTLLESQINELDQFCSILNKTLPNWDTSYKGY